MHEHWAARQTRRADHELDINEVMTGGLDPIAHRYSFLRELYGDDSTEGKCSLSRLGMSQAAKGGGVDEDICLMQTKAGSSASELPNAA